MKVTLNQPLRNMRGEVLKEGTTDLLLKDVLMAVALADLDKEEKAKLEDFNLFLKVKSASEEVELDNKELTRLQEKIKKAYSTLIYGQVNMILEGKGNPIKPVANESK